MTTATSIRFDIDFKRDLQELAKQMGISFSALVTSSLRKTLQERKIEISAPLPEIPLSEKYEQELMNDPDAKETVFVAHTPEESRKYLTSLLS